MFHLLLSLSLSSLFFLSVAALWVCHVRSVPKLGPSLQKPFRQYLEAQRNKLHHAGGSAPADENWLSWVFEKVVLVMVCYFVISIVNSMAQSYAKRLQQLRHSEEKTK